MNSSAPQLMSNSAALSMNKSATPFRSRNVPPSMRGNVKQGLREFVKLLNHSMEVLVEVRHHTVEVQLPVGMEQRKLQFVEMSPRKNVEMYQDNNAEMCLNKNVTVYLDNNAEMFLVSNVPLCPERSSVKSAPTSLRDNALMFQWKNVKMFQNKFQDELVSRSLLKSASLLPDKNARASPRSNVSLWEEKLVRMYQELCAEMFQPRHVKMFQEKFQGTSVRQ